ncbi:MAG TPA: helix-turn-helix domain-containing protein, partial [Abditibacterium sp.]
NANGHAVTVMPSHGELTPNQAAEMLGVSRPFLIRLLDEGQIPFRRVGAHRRIRIDALEKYRSAEEERQLGVLAQLQAQAQELNMGY